MRIIPIDDRLLVKLSDSDKSQYKGQLIIPDNARQRVRVFDVVDVGPKVTKFMIGDKVLISFYTGIYIDLLQDKDPENIRIITEEEIIAKLVED